MFLSPTDRSRLSGIGISHDSLVEVRALVVGAGLLGNEVVRILGTLGIKNVTVVDRDVVEPANLANAALLRVSGAIGRNKAEVLVEGASLLFPDMKLKALAMEIADVGFQEVARHDVLFGCVDNNLARLEIAYGAQRVGIGVADGALGAPDVGLGRVSFFPVGGACFSCVLSDASRQELLTRLQAPAGSCSLTPPSEVATFGTPMMAGMVAAIQVDCGLRLLDRAARDSFACEVRLRPEPRLDRFLIPKGQNCPFHDNDPLVVSTHPYDAGTTVRDLFHRAGWDRSVQMSLVLDWPICVGARCRVCGLRWAPMRRAAILRRRPSCPGCGAAKVVETELIRGIVPGSPWFDRTLTELGMPEDHIYTLRKVA